LAQFFHGAFSLYAGTFVDLGIRPKLSFHNKFSKQQKKKRKKKAFSPGGDGQGCQCFFREIRPEGWRFP